jgi:glycosyltransferase involved in cell wall biosynthesis
MGGSRRHGSVRAVRIAWLSYLDPYVFRGGGELSQRALIDCGRARGHQISVSPFLRRRPQRIVRRIGLSRGVEVDWNADLFVLANIRNAPQIRARFPEDVVMRALDTGRAAIFQNAWVDVCTLDVPCRGDRDRCPPECSRSWGNALYSRALVAIFNSPLQERVIGGVLDVPLPRARVLSRPAIDTQVFRLGGVERDIDVLYVGTISRAKGYYNLLERFGADRMTFAGPSILDEPVQGHYLGPVANADLPAIYSRARIFAHLPEWVEPMGRTVVEAALCGCEIVVNDRVGVTTYPAKEWTDRDAIERNPARFWEDLEAAL